MDLHTHIVPVVYVRQLLAALSKQGVTPQQLLEGTDLSPEAINKYGSFITHAQQMQIQINCARLASASNIGLLMAEKYRAQDLGIYGLVIQTSINFHQATINAARFIPLAAGYSETNLTITDSEYRLRVRDCQTLPGTHQMIIDEIICGYHSVFSHLVDQPIAPLRVTVDYPKPVHAECYPDFFGCPVQFSAEHSEIVYPRAYGALPFKYYDKEANEACSLRCESLLERLREAEDMADRVRKTLLQMNCSRRNAEEVAERLHISARHLRRVLREEGTSFQEVLDEVRYALAKNYLTQTQLSIDQVAPLVGYSETSNFRRAFKKWSGVSPTEYRNQIA